MSVFETKKIELEWKNHVSRHFEKPSDCRNLGQIRFYVNELTSKMEALREKNMAIPEWAYTLLAQYNAAQNRLLLKEFKSTYA